MKTKPLLLFAVAAMLSIFFIPVSYAHAHVDAFKVGDPDGFLMAGLGIAATRTSKPIRELQAKKAEAVKSARAIADAADKEDRDLTDEEDAKFAGLMAEARKFDKRIEREQELLAEEASQFAAGAQSAGNRGFASVHDLVDDDPKGGFRSFGEFAKAVRAGGVGVIDERLRIGAAAPSTYSSEGVGADGGFAVPPQFSGEIWKMSLGEGSLLPMTANTEISSNSMYFPKDETVPWSTTGVQAFWRNEANAPTGSKLVLGSEEMRLHELFVLVPVTNELLEDAPALGSYIQPLAVDRIQWKTNEAILFGTGVGQPLGCMNSNALITVAKETGQATQTLLQPNISKLRSRLLTGNLRNAIWLGTPDLLPALEGLTVGNIPIFLPPNTGIRGDYDGTLNSRPLMLSEHAAAFSSAGDLSLLALNGYRTITKAGGIETATSMHLYFDANATAFRFIFRVDGKPILSQPVTPPKSSNTRSYFVQLGAR